MVQVFKGDGAIPETPLPSFDFEHDDFIGMCVLIPASKYPKFPEVHPDGNEFLGWAGKLVSYESKKKKMKVKICGDRGYESLPVHGSHTYAIESLIRLT